MKTESSEKSPSLAMSAIGSGAAALSAAANTARSGARLALGTFFAGCHVMLDLGVRAARRLPLKAGNADLQVVDEVVGDFPRHAAHAKGRWFSGEREPDWETHAIRQALLSVTQPINVITNRDRVEMGLGGRTILGDIDQGIEGFPLFAYAPALHPAMLGDTSFKSDYGLQYAYLTGAMANGIGSEEIVEAMGRAGMLGFFGAAGLSIDRVATAIDRIQTALGHRPYGFNLIHSPAEPDLESAIVDLYLRRGVRLVDASAYLDLTLPLVRYRVAGIRRDADGRVHCPNRVIGKISRAEVARKFLSPPPEAMLNKLVASGHITSEQAAWAVRIPVAQDLIVEADSGGHTDNRPAVALLPAMIALRDELQSQHLYDVPLRIGAAGGIGTPASACAAFSMGAAFVLTGSINQSCIEAGTSDAVREMLAQASSADVAMAPAADMFEMGVKVQVLKWGTMFSVRARKLYDLYRQYESLEQLPTSQRALLERDYLRCTLDEAWEKTRKFFEKRDPSQNARAATDAKHRMALVFRSYLGQASKWANAGEPGRKVDYQIWCGPAMGAFNEWVRGSFLESWRHRTVVTVGMNIMLGAAVLTRIGWLRAQGVDIPSELARYEPMELSVLQSHLQ
jgi:trans-AT polyketide synthase/acyltransferase/oxidoreductase domain-containing protein